MNRSKGYGLIRNGDLCIWVWSALCVGPLVRIKLVHEGAEASFQLKWGQSRETSLRDVSLLMLGLPINPSYLDLARKSLLLVRSAKVQAPGMLHPQLTMICSPNTPKRLFSPPPIWSSCLFQILFFPLLTLQGLARLLAWLEGVEKKVSKPIGTRAPNLFLESVLFFFENKKATGRNRQYWGERGLFLIWPGLPSVLPRQRHNHSTMGKEGGSDEGGEVFFLQNRGQNYGPSS